MSNNLFTYFLLCVVLNTLVFSNAKMLDTYKLPRCKGKLCWDSVRQFTNDGANAQFDNSARKTEFEKIIKGAENTNTVDYFEDAFVVYAVLDVYLVSKFLENHENVQIPNYNEENFKLLSRSFVYIGSGCTERPREHVYNAKSQCPNQNSNYFHAFSTPTTFYICSSVHDPILSRKYPFGNVIVYPLIAVKTIEVAEKIEYSLIYTLSDLLLNTINVKDSQDDDVHFISHYVLEYTFRYFLNSIKTAIYSHKNTPFFNYNKFSHGLYGTDTSPNKLAFQKTAVYDFAPPDYQMTSQQTVKTNLLIQKIFLPFYVDKFDYVLQNNDRQNVKSLFDSQVKHFFETNAPNVYRLYISETANVMKKDEKSLRKNVELFYTILSACIEIQENTDDKIFLYILFQRFRAKIEFVIMRYLYANQVYYYEDWDVSAENSQIEKQNFPQNVNLNALIAKVEICDEE